MFAQASWGGYLAAIDKDVTELRSLRSSVIHQTELFENMTNSVCDAGTDGGESLELI